MHKMIPELLATDFAVIYPCALAFDILVLPIGFYTVKEGGFSARMDRNRFVKHVDDKRQGSGPNRSASASLGNIAVRRLISAEDP